MDNQNRFRGYTGNPVSDLITVLIIVCILLGFLLYREHVHNKRLYRKITEANTNLSTAESSLVRRDYLKAQTALAKTQLELIALLNTPSIFEKLHIRKTAQPSRTIKPPFIPPRPLKPTNKIPSALVLAPEGEHILLCEKKSRTLSLYKYAGNTFSLVKSYPALIGKNGHDKNKAGDMATPEGAYFITRFIPDKDLPEQYGVGAFTLSYPNFWDVKNGKSGQGIWVHGHNPAKTFADIENTKGCIVVDNEALTELMKFVKPGLTPIAVVDEITYLAPDRQKELSGQLSAFLDAWRQAWEALDNQKYFAFYAPAEFTNKDGMNFAAFKKFKEQVNKNKKFVKIKLANTVILIVQKAGQEIAFVQFDQDYKSNNLNSASRKTLYLKKIQQKWLIIGEV